MTLHHGDCLEVMAGMEPESVDAVVTDPPYGLEFMGKEWDRLASILPESAGYNKPGSRAKKSPMDTWGKRPSGYVAGPPMQEWHARWAEAAFRVAKPSAYLLAFGGTRTVHRMTCAIEDAGWIIRDMLVWGYASGFPKSKASLKPAWEPIVMARKPGPLRMLAIDDCRIGVAGRWPANIVLTDAIFDGGIEGVAGGGVSESGLMRAGTLEAHGSYGGFPGRDMAVDTYGDSGTYSRFFLVPKASRTDREPVLTPDWFEGTGRVSTHPTVKPVDLMRHLVRLVTPTGGIVLDPFGGSGTTALACELEGFPWVLIEREAEYVAIAEARLNGVQRGLGLPA